MNLLAQAAANLLNAIVLHWQADAIGGGVLFAAIVTNMPARMPASLQDYWDWVRESLQTAIPVRRPTQHNLNPNNPAQPEKE